ncbi:MAG: hypothetical protein KAT11_04180 [Phycisphaerae bacterium]|nr:hypothetical protein [Phycisphaerae bacterium]
MSVNEIERVKEDIDTIKEAAGLGLPFGWDYAWLYLFAPPALGVWFLAYWLIADRPSRYVMVAPAVLLLAVLGYLRFKHRRSTGSSAIKRREYGINFYGSIIIGAVIAVFVIWVKRTVINTAYLGSGVLIMGGLMVTLMAFQGKQRISYLGSGIPGILFGISMAVWPTADAVIRNGCIMLVVAGPATALIMMYQLKHSGTAK